MVQAANTVGGGQPSQLRRNATQKVRLACSVLWWPKLQTQRTSSCGQVEPKYQNQLKIYDSMQNNASVTCVTRCPATSQDFRPTRERSDPHKTQRCAVLLCETRVILASPTFVSLLFVLLPTYTSYLY